MKLYIKNMVCDRCKMVVKTGLEQLGFNPIEVQLGEVSIIENKLSEAQIERIRQQLDQTGFELLTDPKKQMVAKIKAAIINLVHYQNEPLKINLSFYLAEKLFVSYSLLSTSFSELENNTIEHFFILQKIEKVKELLAYGEKSLSEIAFLLNYSSVAHLSAQFKKVSKQTPSQFRLNHHLSRQTLDRI